MLSNISDFSLFFYVKTATPLKKVTPLFPSNPTLKTKILSSPPFLKIWSEAQPHLQKGGGGVHTMDFVPVPPPKGWHHQVPYIAPWTPAMLGVLFGCWLSNDLPTLFFPISFKMLSSQNFSVMPCSRTNNEW